MVKILPEAVPNNFSVLIEASRGKGVTSDYAIDDLLISEGSCGGKLLCLLVFVYLFVFVWVCLFVCFVLFVLFCFVLYLWITSDVTNFISTDVVKPPHLLHLR